MAACGSLQHIFEKPLPDNPSLLESLSPWNQIKAMKPVEQSSFTEIFGELHFKESSSSSSYPFLSSVSPVGSSSQTGIKKLNKDDGLDENDENRKSSALESFSCTQKIGYTGCHKKSDSFSSMNSESLQLCTEGLGSESSDDVENLKSTESNKDWQNQEGKGSLTKHLPAGNLYGESRRSRTSGGAFPPPISCIGKSGKPWVCFKSYRHDGRFVLKEIRIPTQEFLHARREDGRLKMHFVHPNDEILEEEDDDEDHEEEEDYGKEDEEETVDNEDEEEQNEE